MKRIDREDLFNAITNLPDEQIVQPDSKAQPAVRRLLRPRVWVPLAASLTIILSIFFFERSDGVKAMPLYTGSIQLAAAEYKLDESKLLNNTGFSDTTGSFTDLTTELSGFFQRSSGHILSGAQGENMVFSPVNLYMELCMTAEITSGDSRRQILNLLEGDSIEDLRENAKTVWNRSFCEGDSEMLLANSLWMDNSTDFNQQVLDVLARDYYADSFRGEPGSEEYNNMFHDWLNQRTDGLLKDEVAKERIFDETVMGLASTTFFKASWLDKFNSEYSIEGIFNGAKGEETCTYMKDEYYTTYFWGDKFSAVGRPLNDGNMMLFVLPAEGVSVEQMLSDDEYLEFMACYGRYMCFNESYENSGVYRVNLTVPKFDVRARKDIASSLKAMGVTDIFDSTKSDFSPLSKTNLFVSTVNQACRVMIDENGCTGASYIVMMMEGAGVVPMDQEVDFTLDRPFVFSVVTNSGLPLYMGVVNSVE